MNEDEVREKLVGAEDFVLCPYKYSHHERFC